MHPRIVMIAVDYPFVRIHAAGNRRDHIKKRFCRPVEIQLQMDARRPTANVVGERQGTAPALWCNRTTQVGEQRLGVLVGDRQDRYLHDAGSF